VDECVRGVGVNPEPRYHCFGGFRHWRITLRSLGAYVPKRFGAHGRRRVFLWRYHGLSPWGSMSLKFAMRFMCFTHSMKRLEKRAGVISIWLANGTGRLGVTYE